MSSVGREDKVLEREREKESQKVHKVAVYSCPCTSYACVLYLCRLDTTADVKSLA